MEAGSHSGIARLVQPSLGTSALFPSYGFVTTYPSLIYVLICSQCSASCTSATACSALLAA
jgi:hypothetical protein